MIPTYQNKSHFVSKQSRKRLTSIGDLPKSDEELIRYFQSYGILPSKENSLELRLTHFPYDEKKHKNGKYLGDKLNGGFKLKVSLFFFPITPYHGDYPRLSPPPFEIRPLEKKISDTFFFCF